jgi:hypothetical protein
VADWQSANVRVLHITPAEKILAPREETFFAFAEPAKSAIIQFIHSTKSEVPK